MTKINTNEYDPNNVSPPGATLAEVLEDRGMSQAEFAERTGRPRKTINEIIKGKSAITPETALQFELVLGISASFWNERERNYREALARRSEHKRLVGQLGWLGNFPVKDMVNLGWIKEERSKLAEIRTVLNYFGVASPVDWDRVWTAKQAAFRKSLAFRADRFALAAWMRRGEIEANEIDCNPYDPRKFRISLTEIRSLTLQRSEVFEPQVIRSCASAGVAVVFVPELKGTRIFGATQWLSREKALIELSLRYKSDDHLWFTFFHEAAHLLLHPKTAVFVEGGKADGVLEKEADKFAEDLLVPRKHWEEFVSNNCFSKVAIRTFSNEVRIAPGIVVGRLQHAEYLPPSFCNDLKRRIQFRSYA